VVPPDFEPEIRQTVQQVRAFTMTSPERIHALCNAVRYIINNDIPGALVECGVWRGGSMMAAARTLLDVGARDRHLYLFDSFEGMPRPGRHDRSLWGADAEEEWSRRGGDSPLNAWARASLEDVTANMKSTGYPQELIHFVRGRVEDTIPGASPSNIALLRLDTDWYESTRHEMEHLFPRVSPGGVLIVDDYGHWQGSRRAVDEYVARHAIPLLLARIDYTGRIAVKIRS
jgi:hypothetical protein